MCVQVLLQVMEVCFGTRAAAVAAAVWQREGIIIETGARGGKITH